MSSVAIFPSVFSSAGDLAKDLSQSLGLKIYDDSQLLADTAEKAGVSVTKLARALYGKTSVFNQFTLEREKALSELKIVLAEKIGDQQNYLFYGLMTVLISNQVSHVLRVVIVDSKQGRIDRGVARGLSVQDAKKTVKAEDVKAFGLTDFLFKKEAYDSSLYDLVLPVEGKSQEELVDTLSQYFRTTSVLVTSRSQQAAVDMLTVAKVEREMCEAGHRVSVSARDDELHIEVQKSVFNFDKLSLELEGVAKKVGGVGRVVVEKGYEYNQSIYRKQEFDLPSKVLFVDDEKDFVQTVSERLISRDVGTYGVFDGEQALNVIQEDRPDVMVLDLKMPGLYGVEVLRRAKELDPEVEVIILTGHGSNQDMIDCMKLGAFAYLNKPVDIEELSATIKAAHKKKMSPGESVAA